MWIKFMSDLVFVALNTQFVLTYLQPIFLFLLTCVRVCARLRVFVHACVRACVCVCLNLYEVSSFGLRRV